MIKTLSPYYVDLPFVAPTSGLTCTSVTLNLYIWEGLKTATPSTPTYQLTKENPTASTGNTRVKINRLVNDFIQFKPTYIASTESVDSENQVWVKWETTHETTDPLDLNPTNEITKLAIKGYNYGMDGENTETPINRLLIPIAEYKANKKFIVPIEIDEVATSNVIINSTPLGTINKTLNISNTNNSKGLVQNIYIDVSEAGTDTDIQVIYNSQQIDICIQNECRYDPIDIVFLNKEGGLSSLCMFKKSVESISTSKDEYEIGSGQPLDGIHQYEVYNKQGKTKLSVNSGFVDESLNEIFKQLLLSQKVWKLDGSQFTPLNVSSSRLEYKTRINDRLINYNIDFDYAFNEINNI